MKYTHTCYEWMNHKNNMFSKEPGQRGPHITSFHLYEMYRKGKSTWSQDLMKLRFLMSHGRKNSVRDKVIGKK